METDRAATLYDEDFFAWTRSQARELRRFARTRPNVALDVEHIAEEIADLGTERRDALRSWTARVIEHLLLLEHSPAQELRRGWIDEVVNFRTEIERRLSRTLQRDLKRRLPLLYDEARRNLRRKLERYGEAEIADRSPEQCPFALEQVLGDYWPPRVDRSGSASRRAVRQSRKHSQVIERTSYGAMLDRPCRRDDDAGRRRRRQDP